AWPASRRELRRPRVHCPPASPPPAPPVVRPPRGAPVRVCRTVDGLRSATAEIRASGRRLALVPTMGALHAGHLSLLPLAAADGHAVAISIFVNPLQFGAGEDFQHYPRDEAADLALAEAEGAELAFVPGVAELYPEGFATTV